MLKASSSRLMEKGVMMGKRELILAKLERLSVDGLTPVTVVQLATAVGLSRSSLYKYYPDVIAKLRLKSAPGQNNRCSQEALKISLLKSRVVDQKSLIDTLATICSNQLIEFIEFKAASSDEADALKLKIAFLERELAKLKKPSLKVVK